MIAYTIKSCVSEHPPIGVQLETATALRMLERLHPACAQAPQLVVHVVSCEAQFLVHPVNAVLADAIVARWPTARHQAVALGCLGMYAALHHVASINPEAAVIYIYELPADQIQGHFDRLGIGTEAKGGGMVAEEGMACLYLLRNDVNLARSGDIRILDCQIEAKGGSLSGTRRMLNELEAQMARVLPMLDHWVMFDVATHWSSMLVRWFHDKFDKELARLNLIPSSEQGADYHRMSFKPANELAIHLRTLLPGQKLGLGSVGIGGRFGWITLSALDPAQPLEPLSRECCGDGWQLEDVHLHRISMSEEHARSALYCVSEQHLGINNRYFVWNIIPDPDVFVGSDATPAKSAKSAEPVATVEPIHFHEEFQSI
jgi:hypothetical protein